jgi:hypothetical protein
MHRDHSRLEAGEPMTVEYVADQLGMPFELFAEVCALYAAPAYDVLVEIDASSRQTIH